MVCALATIYLKTAKALGLTIPAILLARAHEVIVSERQAQLTRQAVNYIVRLAGEKAKLGRVWPHMLRHSCGYYLADRGTDLRTMQDYLGHRDPKHTAHYTRVAGHRFEGSGRELEITQHKANATETGEGRLTHRRYYPTGARRLTRTKPMPCQPRLGAATHQGVA